MPHVTHTLKRLLPGIFQDQVQITLATGLLRAGVPLPTISAVLGHASEDSSGDYMSTDRERMLQCVLPVPAGALR